MSDVLDLCSVFGEKDRVEWYRDEDDEEVWLCQWVGGCHCLPRLLPLDSAFGFLVGAYMAEGWAAEGRGEVEIANTDPRYRRLTMEFLERHGVNFSETRGHDGGIKAVRFSSRLLNEILARSCRRGAYQKALPMYALDAPMEFVRALLDGYVSGDGSVSARGAWIELVSRSFILLFGVKVLMTKRLGLDIEDFSEATRQIERRPGEPMPMYRLYLRASGTLKFSCEVELCIWYKQDRLARALLSSYYGFDDVDEEPGDLHDFLTRGFFL